MVKAVIDETNKSSEKEEEEKSEAKEIELTDEIIVGNITVDISADECAVKVSLKTSNKGYVKEMDYIHAFL